LVNVSDNETKNEKMKKDEDDEISAHVGLEDNRFFNNYKANHFSK